jgi:hypothetical protein
VAGEKHLFVFGVDIHNPYTPNDVSAYTGEVRVAVPTDVLSPEVITKKICSPAALRKVFVFKNHFSIRQKLIYSSYRSRGREYKQTPHIGRKKHQRSKDYKPQERNTLVVHKTISGLCEILSKGQRGGLLCRVLAKLYGRSGQFGLICFAGGGKHETAIRR